MPQTNFKDKSKLVPVIALVLSGNKPLTEAMLTDLFHPMALQGHNELCIIADIIK